MIPELIMLLKANWLLRLFGLFKVPLIGYCRPRVTSIDEDSVAITIPLRRRTRNHLGSMYFGALAVGADLAGGSLAVFLAEQRKLKISLAFKSVSGEFYKRPEHDVVFTCNDGRAIAAMIAEAEASSERINRSVHVNAHCPAQIADEVVASFELMLSIKVLV
jgi:hypothetical protein